MLAGYNVFLMCLFSEITANQKGKNAEEKLKLNTYELNPKNIIPRCLVYELMKGIIKEAASNTEGESFTLKDKCELIKTACEEVKQQIKTLLLGEKYKVVSTCSFIDTTRFSGIVASNCLWNKQYDTFIDYKHQVKSGCIVCIVYFVTID